MIEEDIYIYTDERTRSQNEDNMATSSDTCQSKGGKDLSHEGKENSKTIMNGSE